MWSAIVAWVGRVFGQAANFEAVQGLSQKQNESLLVQYERLAARFEAHERAGDEYREATRGRIESMETRLQGCLLQHLSDAGRIRELEEEGRRKAARITELEGLRAADAAEVAALRAEVAALKAAMPRS